MEVRSAGMADVEAVARVARRSWHAAYDDLLGPGTVERTVEEWYDPAELAEQVDRGEFVVAEADEIVGFAHAGENEREERTELFRIYVDPDCWGEGVGSRLLRSVAGRLLAAGHEELYAVVLAANDVGRSFYEAHGFEPVERGDAPIGEADVEELLVRAPLEELTR